MQPPACQRLGLSANPFHAEALEGSAAAWHVEQEADRDFWAAQRESLYGRGSAMVAVLGPPGSGKSHRLAIAASRAARAGIFHVTHRLAGSRPDGLVSRLASSILNGCPLGNLGNALAAPRWYRNLLPLTRRSSLQGRPGTDGVDLARAINANAPAFLLLDDLHRLPISRAADKYLETLTHLRAGLDPGVLLAWTAQDKHSDQLVARFPELLDAGTHPIRLAPLAATEARSLIAMRLKSCRIVDGVDDLFPFTPEAIDCMNEQAHGNPACLVQFAELMVESAPARGAFELDRARVEDFLMTGPAARLQRAQSSG